MTRLSRIWLVLAIFWLAATPLEAADRILDAHVHFRVQQAGGELDVSFLPSFPGG